MRLSRPRLILRAALLVVGGGFMLWKAVEAGRAARGAHGGEALLLGRVALVEALVGVLALGAAAIALLALRPKKRRHTLQLDDADRRA